MSADPVHSEIKEVAKHTTVFGIGQILQQGVSLLLLPLYVSRIPTADYGVLNLLLIGATMIGLLSKTSIVPAVFRSYYDYQEERQRRGVVTTAMLYVGVAAAVLVGGGCLFSHQLSWLLTGETVYGELTRWVLISSWFTTLNDVALAVFRAKKLSRPYMLISLGQLLLSLGAVVLLVLIRGMGITGVVLGRLAGVAAGTVATLFVIGKDLSGRFSSSELKKMLKYGVPHIPENGIAFVSHSASKLILRVLVGATGVGVFAMAYRIGSVVQTLLIMPFSLIAPSSIFSMEKSAEAGKFYGKLFFNYVLVTGLFTVLVSSVTEPVLLWFAKPDYHQSWVIVPFIGFALVAYGARGLVSVPLMLTRKTFWFPITYVAGTVVELATLLILIPLAGPVGAGISMLLGNLVICYLRNRLGSRYMKIGLGWRRIAGVLLVLILIGLLAGMIDVGGYAVSILLRTVFTLCGAWLLLRALSLMDRQDVRLQREIALAVVNRLRGGRGRLSGQA